MEINDPYHEIIGKLERQEAGSEGSFKISEIIAKKSSEQFVSFKNNKSKQDNLINAAKYRDIGKLKIDKDILNSQDFFYVNDSRWDIIKKHPQKSVEILKQGENSFHKEVFEIIRHHHPWYFDESNGEYTLESVSNSVILSFQIVSIIDAYIGLRAKRIRRTKKYNHVEAMSEINKDVENNKFPGTLVLLLGPILDESYRRITDIIQ